LRNLANSESIVDTIWFNAFAVFAIAWAVAQGFQFWFRMWKKAPWRYGVLVAGMAFSALMVGLIAVSE
jgi:hypothetical protein